MEHYYIIIPWYIYIVVVGIQLLWFIEFMTCFRHFDNLSELEYAEDGKSGVCIMYRVMEENHKARLNNEAIYLVEYKRGFIGVMISCPSLDPLYELFLNLIKFIR